MSIEDKIKELGGVVYMNSQGEIIWLKGNTTRVLKVTTEALRLCRDRK